MTQQAVLSLKDLPIMDEIREVFHASTGLALSLQYSAHEYDFYPITERTPYCGTIQSVPEGVRRCVRSDCAALRKAKSSGENRVYACHANLLNAVIPIVYKGRDLGALLTGQILTAEPSEEDFRRVYGKLAPLGIPRGLLYEQYRKVKVLDPDRFLLGVRLLGFMANHILAVENEKMLQAELHFRERELLKSENARMRLQSGMQRLSLSVLEHGREGGAHPSHRDHIVARAQGFIRENYGQPLMLADVARAVYLSPNHFSRIFKEKTGFTFSNYLNRVRVEEGKKLLSETEIPIKEIVPRLGFEDYNYFNRIFRKLAGVPPAAYRAGLQSS